MKNIGLNQMMWKLCGGLCVTSLEVGKQVLLVVVIALGVLLHDAILKAKVPSQVAKDCPCQKKALKGPVSMVPVADPGPTPIVPVVKEPEGAAVAPAAGDFGPVKARG